LIGKRIALLRQKHNLSQEQVAEYLGVHRTTYSHYETGRTDIDNNSIVLLAKKYNVSIDYLFGQTDIPYPAESFKEDETEFLMKTLDVYREIKTKFN
jgi:transcriptional regulator with XRE-family HTH domain